VRAASAGEGQGATFCVQLPLMIVRPEGVDAPRQHPRSERREPLTQLGDLHGIRVVAMEVTDARQIEEIDAICGPLARELGYGAAPEGDTV